jgi:hypothetical protein
VDLVVANGSAIAAFLLAFTNLDCEFFALLFRDVVKEVGTFYLFAKAKFGSASRAKSVPRFSRNR